MHNVMSCNVNEKTTKIIKYIAVAMIDSFLTIELCIQLRFCVSQGHIFQ